MLLIAVLFAAGSSAWAQPAPDELLYRRLTVGGKEVAVAALEQILKAPEAVSATVLYSAVDVAARENRVADAAFLFYIARFRVQYDRELFPSASPEADSPLPSLSALQKQWVGVIVPAVMAYPKAFASALARVKTWQPKVPAGYQPGWKFTGRGSEARAAAVMEASRKQFLEVMGGLSTLLQDKAYFDAFRICQAYNTETSSVQPSKDAYNAALKTLERIEKEKGIPGIAAQSKK
mgnify:CR=1 FL=1